MLKVTKYIPVVFKRFGSILTKSLTKVCFTEIQCISKTLLQSNSTALNSVIDKMVLFSVSEFAANTCGISIFNIFSCTFQVT